MTLPVRLPTGSGAVELRRARAEDLAGIVALLTDDVLGRDREDVGPAPYQRSFALVDADPAHLLLVAVAGEEVVGTLQLTVLPGLSRRGALRAQLEGVRVAASFRGCGLGAAMIGWAVDEARRRGCTLVQLTTDKARTDAHRFYAHLGFSASHEGFKLVLDPNAGQPGP